MLHDGLCMLEMRVFWWSRWRCVGGGCFVFHSLWWNSLPGNSAATFAASISRIVNIFHNEVALSLDRMCSRVSEAATRECLETVTSVAAIRKESLKRVPVASKRTPNGVAQTCIETNVRDRVDGFTVKWPVTIATWFYLIIFLFSVKLTHKLDVSAHRRLTFWYERLDDRSHWHMQAADCS